MKLNWNINDIQNNLKIIKDESSDFSKTKENIYTCMLTDIGILKEENNQRISCEQFFKVFEQFDYNYLNSSVFKLISYISNSLPSFNLDSITRNYTNFDPESSIKICQDFYKKRNKNSLSYFKKIISFDNRIHFHNINKFILGRSYIIAPEDFYILIGGNDDLQNSLSIVHEFKHIENQMKGYSNGIGLYQELPSILYELYMLKYLYLSHSKEEIDSLKINTIYKYVKLINNLNDKIEFIKRMLNDELFLYNIYENFDLYYNDYNLEDIYDILKDGCSKTIGYILSFIIAIDIYINSKESDASNAVSCYIFGMYKMKPSIIDGVINYIENTLNDYLTLEKMKKVKK